MAELDKATVQQMIDAAIRAERQRLIGALRPIIDDAQRRVAEADQQLKESHAASGPPMGAFGDLANDPSVQALDVVSAYQPVANTLHELVGVLVSWKESTLKQTKA